jgi:hypothetical protein
MECRCIGIDIAILAITSSTGCAMAPVRPVMALGLALDDQFGT